MRKFLASRGATKVADFERVEEIHRVQPLSLTTDTGLTLLEIGKPHYVLSKLD